MARKSRKETVVLPAPEIDTTCRAGVYVRLSVEDQQNADAILISKLFQCTGLLIVICIHSAVSIAYTHFLKRIDDNQANIAVCMNQRFYLFL